MIHGKPYEIHVCAVFLPVPPLARLWAGRCRRGGEHEQRGRSVSAVPVCRGKLPRSWRHTLSTRLCTIASSSPKPQGTNLGTRLAAMHHEGSLPQGCAGGPPKQLGFTQTWTHSFTLLLPHRHTSQTEAFKWIRVQFPELPTTYQIQKQLGSQILEAIGPLFWY